MLPVENQVEALQKMTESFFICLFGGVSYYGLEMLWQGTSHWSMALCGAIGFFHLYRINRRYLRSPLPLRALMGACFITAMELTIGCILNLGLGWNIWDYSALPLHFLGQICLPYSILWFLLCFPVAALSRWIRRVVFLSDA